MSLTRKDILHAELSYAICKLCFNVHNSLGRFRSEKSYADALEQQLKDSQVHYEREMALPPSFKGEIERRNIPDFIIENKIILDCKAKRIITREDYYQMQRYLAVYDRDLGLIVNFQQQYLAPKRILNSHSRYSDNHS